MLRVLLCLSVIGASAVQAQDAPVVWRLVSLNGADFTARATLSFLEDGTLQGEGPCNGFGGQLTALPPAWAMGAVRATRMACDDLAAEQVFFDALAAMTAAAVTAESLTLTGPEGAVMVFAASGG
ncbi:MAG: META domain-containing protein [Paracoccaceae bacterium]